MSVGNREEIIKSPDGYSWELWSRVLPWSGDRVWWAAHRVTGERLLGGTVSNDRDEIVTAMNLPR